MNIAPKPCPFCGETRTRLMTTNTAATKAVDLLDRMAGFLDGMYRRPPPIVEKLLAEYEEIRATPPAEPASAADGAKPIIPNWFPDDRCQVCGWPLAPSRDQGCVAGDCSFRPQEGTDSYRITQLRRKALAERADPAQSADTPVIATDNDDTPSEAVALLREAIEALEGWDDDPVDGDTWIARAERYIESASRPQPARGGNWQAPFHATRTRFGYADRIDDVNDKTLVHLNTGTMRNESEGGVEYLLSLLNRSARGEGDIQQIIYALERARSWNDETARKLHGQQDYGASFYDEDALRIEEAISLLRGPAHGEVSEAEVEAAALAIAKVRFGASVAWPENVVEAKVALEAAARVRESRLAGSNAGCADNCTECQKCEHCGGSGFIDVLDEDGEAFVDVCDGPAHDHESHVGFDAGLEVGGTAHRKVSQNDD
jgi:hypothetical protein